MEKFDGIQECGSKDVTVDISSDNSKRDSPPKDKSWKDILNEFAEDTTAQGIPHIITKPKLVSKIFWSLLLLVACGLLFWQSAQIIGAFYSYNTRIELVSKREINFPAVTVCNLNRMKRSKLVETRYEGLINIDGGWSFDGGEPDYEWFFDFSSAFWETNSDNYLVTVNPSDGESSILYPGDESYFWDWSGWNYADLSWRFEYDDYYDWDAIKDENDWQKFYEESVSEDFSDFLSAINPTWQELKDYGHEAEDFIIQCTFDKRKCTYKDFKVFQNKEYGNCFTFNGKVNSEKPDVVRNTTKSGSKFGLTLTLFIEEPEYVGVLSPESGVRVVIHSNDVFPYPEDTGLYAGPGQDTSIGIRQTELTRLVAPWGSCTDGTDGKHNHLYHEDYRYTQRSCEKKCLYDKMAEKCGCITDIYPEYHEPKCSAINSTQQKCRHLVEELYAHNNLGCDCPIPCHEFAYDVQSSTSLWPSERYEEHLLKRLKSRGETMERILESAATTKKNLVRIKVFFEDLNYESIEQVKANTIYGILSAIGGLMGLYVGISVLTLVELMVFAYEVITHLVKGCLSSRKLNPVTD